ncbi:hypothetical protein COPEUT_01688 [Coprococcus eutactus ATCC 27759]|nr:hypothetical protein COPEUT_01688 [Coprococcus eutactus ATCC 27759]
MRRNIFLHNLFLFVFLPYKVEYSRCLAKVVKKGGLQYCM